MAIPFFNESSEILDRIPIKSYFDNFFKEGIEKITESLSKEEYSDTFNDNTWVNQYPIDIYNIRNDIQNTVIEKTKNPNPKSILE